MESKNAPLPVDLPPVSEPAAATLFPVGTVIEDVRSGGRWSIRFQSQHAAEAVNLATGEVELLDGEAAQYVTVLAASSGGERGLPPPAAEAQPGEAEPEQGSLALEAIWPPFEGHAIHLVELALSGSIDLYAGNPFAMDLASRIHGGARLTLICRASVEGLGHRVLRDPETKMAIGRVGTAKLRIRQLVDPDEVARTLHEQAQKLAEIITEIERVEAELGPPDPEIPHPWRSTLTRLRNVAWHGLDYAEREEAARQ